MRLIAKKNLESAIESYSDDAKAAIAVWRKFIKENDCESLEYLRQKYAKSVDQVYDYTIFNIKGNEYRLIVQINYTTIIIYFKEFLSHAEYNRINWNNEKKVKQRIG
jgi:mRNA interferase HigB